MKTLAQTNKEKSLPLTQLVGNMYKEQGIAGFYRGYVMSRLGFVVCIGVFSLSPEDSCHSSLSSASLFASVEANILRACVLNATKMGCYDMTKGYVTQATGWSRKDVRTAFCSSFVAGFLMTCTVSPFDRIRTNLMNQPTDAKIYNGTMDCLTKTVQRDGVMSLWRGFIPIWARFAPQATLQLLTLEFLYGLFGFSSI